MNVKYQISQVVTFWSNGLCGSGCKIVEIKPSAESFVYRLRGVNGWFTEDQLKLEDFLVVEVR